MSGTELYNQINWPRVLHCGVLNYLGDLDRNIWFCSDLLNIGRRYHLLSLHVAGNLFFLFLGWFHCESFKCLQVIICLSWRKTLTHNEKMYSSFPKWLWCPQDSFQNVPNLNVDLRIYLTYSPVSKWVGILTCFLQEVIVILE